MKHRNLCFVLLFVSTLISCQVKTSLETTVQDSIKVEEFDLAYSDPAAVQLADSIMAAVGGMEAWNATRFISWTFQDWNFFWDKKLNHVRAESNASIFVFDANGKGKGKVNGEQVKSPDLENNILYLQRLFGESKQILMMPFLLKEGSNRLTYEGEVTSEQTGLKRNILRVNFDTLHSLQLKECQLLVDLKDNLIRECLCIYTIDSTALIPLGNYTAYGKIRLSDSHSRNIKIEENLPADFFSKL